MKRAAGPPALVIAGGDLPADRVVRLEARRVRSTGGVIICADGGVRHAARLGIRPDAVLGDLDSAPRAALASFPGVPVIRVPDQESTDLEKALRWCLAAKCGSATVVGAIGDRIDHSTGALGCLRRFGRKLRLSILDRSGELRLLARSESIPVARGETFSLIPLGRVTGVRLGGALYPLRGETLEPGVREGISNRAAGPTLTVRHRTGAILIYRLRRQPRRGPVTGAATGGAGGR